MCMFLYLNICNDIQSEIQLQAQLLGEFWPQWIGRTSAIS